MWVGQERIVDPVGRAGDQRVRAGRQAPSPGHNGGMPQPPADTTVTITFAGSGDAFGSGGRYQACIELTTGTTLTACGATVQAWEGDHPNVRTTDSPSGCEQHQSSHMMAWLDTVSVPASGVQGRVGAEVAGVGGVGVQSGHGVEFGALTRGQPAGHEFCLHLLQV